MVSAAEVLTFLDRQVGQFSHDGRADTGRLQARERTAPRRRVPTTQKIHALLLLTSFIKQTYLNSYEMFIMKVNETILDSS